VLRNYISPVERDLRTQIILWERENTASLLENGKADPETAQHFLTILDERTKIPGNRSRPSIFKRIMWFLRHVIKPKKNRGTTPKRRAFEAVVISNTQFVQEKLKEIKNSENAAIVEKLAVELELRSMVNRSMYRRNSDTPDSARDSVVFTVAMRGCSIERELIQEMSEAGRISEKTAKEMREAITTLETQLQSDILI